MPQTLLMLQVMVETAIASKNIGQLIQAKRSLVGQRREQYEDVTVRNSLYKLIGRLNEAINAINLATVDRVLEFVTSCLTDANNLVSSPPIDFNAKYLAEQVNMKNIRAKASVDELEQDRHLSPLLIHRQGVLTHLKTDIKSLSRGVLIVAAIEECQQLQRQQEAKRRQQLEAATKRLREQQCEECLRQSEHLKQLLGQFDSAINIHDINQARHVLWMIVQQNPESLSLALHNQKPDMALAHMKQQVESLRRDLYGHHGIRNLDASPALRSRVLT